MKHKLKAVLFLFTCFLIQLNAQEFRMMTFEEALSLSMANNFGIKATEKEIEIKEREKKATQSLYLPNISIAASYVTMSDPLHLDLTPVKDAITPIYSALGNYGVFSGVPNPDPATQSMLPILPDNISTQAVRGNFADGLQQLEAADWNTVLQKQNFGFANANLTLPLFTGGKIKAANEAASIYQSEAENDNQIKISEVQNQLVERYFAWVLASEALSVRKEVHNTMQLHLKNAQHMKDEGVIANAEYLHVRVFSSEAQRNVKKSERQLSIAKKALSNTLSSTDDFDFTPGSRLFINHDLPSLDYFLNQAPAHSELLKKVAFKKELVETKHKVEKGDFLPSFALMGTYNIAEKDLSHLVPKYTVGVGMKWELFSGISRIRNVQASNLQLDKVAEIYSQVSMDVSTMITKLYEELQMYTEQMVELESAEDFANEYYRVRESAFVEGISTASEVSDANLARAKVKIEMLQNMYSYDVALSQLLYYTGLSSTYNSYRN